MADIGVKDGVRVNAINPGLIETERFGRTIERTMRNRSCSREEAIAFLLSSQRHDPRRAAGGNRRDDRVSRLAPEPTSCKDRSSTSMAARHALDSDIRKAPSWHSHRNKSPRGWRISPSTRTPRSWPDAVHREALRSFFNVVGCTIGGARHEHGRYRRQTLGAFAGAPQATLFGRGRKADILHAALINGLASSIYSFDDTHETAVVHPRGPIAAAVLALAELRPVSGADLLTAFALGVEMTCRLCLGTTVPPADGSFAWSGTGISMGFGAAVAAGRLLRLDTQRMRVAMGLALSEAVRLPRHARHGVGRVHAGARRADGIARGVAGRARLYRRPDGPGGKIRVSVSVLHDTRPRRAGRRSGRTVRTPAQYL